MYGAFGLLLVAIASEVAATATLPRADGFRNPLWSVLVCAGYALSIWLLALVVDKMPVSIAYAVWAGLGTALVAVIGVLFLHESVDAMKVAAIGLIIGGVVILNLQTSH